MPDQSPQGANASVKGRIPYLQSPGSPRNNTMVENPGDQLPLVPIKFREKQGNHQHAILGELKQIVRTGNGAVLTSMFRTF